MDKRLVLVDIDNYLIRNSLQLNQFALQNLFKIKFRLNIWKKIQYEETDSFIFQKICQTFQLNLSTEQLSNLKRDYVLELFKLIKNNRNSAQLDPISYNNIKELLEQKIIIGSFASSFFDNIRMKLIPLNIFHHFQFGAFGEDATSVTQLIEVAKEILKIQTKETFSETYYLSEKNYKVKDIQWLNNNTLGSILQKKEF